MTENREASGIRVMLADDHVVVRAGFRRLVEAMPGMEVVAEAETGEDAVSLYLKEKPDLVLMDLSMPGIGGLEALRRIRTKDPGARVIIISVHDDISYVKRVLNAGAQGYLSKRAGPEALVDTVQKVLRGERNVEPSLANRLLFERAKDGNAVTLLTDREFEVFRMLSEGLSVNRISVKLFLSPKTIETYRTRLFQKLGISNIAELTRLAIRQGLIEP
jgi:two-component system invasion response regulator UvrY